jgi:thiopeptide-type bacteriocin biosynthesis protein
MDKHITTGWLGAHLFYEGLIYSPSCDRVLIEVVEPFVRAAQSHGWVDRYFFIRYREHGSHVRLRLHGAADVLENEVKPGLEEHANIMSILSSIRWVPYQPEFARYGGQRGVELAETLFFQSSEAAFDIIRHLCDKERPSRLGKGLLAMLSALHVFFPNSRTASSFASRYAAGYLSHLVRDDHRLVYALKTAFHNGYNRQAETLSAYVETAWLCLNGSGALPRELHVYHERLKVVQMQFDLLARRGLLLSPSGPFASPEAAALRIVPSYVHMMSNRLGISIPEEAYLAHLIANTLNRQAERSILPAPT